MPTLLIVDDQPFCRVSLARLLEMRGYRVTQASDGLEALAMVAADAPDLILLDLWMPGMDGVGFLTALRGDGAHGDLPVLLMTGMHDVAAVAEARRLGIQGYLFKGDVSFVDILVRIKHCLGEAFVRPRRGRKPKVPRPVEAAVGAADELPPGMSASTSWPGSLAADLPGAPGHPGDVRRKSGRPAPDRGARDRAFWAREVASLPRGIDDDATDA